MPKPPKTRIAVVYHSGSGHTAPHARAVAAGAEQGGAQALLVRVEDAGRHWQDLERADAIVFGCPTYMGSASSAFKQFMDDSAHHAFAGRRWRDKLAAGFTNAASRSGDKLATLQQLAIFAAQHGMHWVNLGLPAGHNRSSSSEDTLNRHGFFLGAAAQSDFDLEPGAAATEADLRTAEHLGMRVAQVARELAQGRATLALAAA